MKQALFSVVILCHAHYYLPTPISYKLLEWTTIHMTEGKSVEGEAPSAPFGYCTVLFLVGKWITIDTTEDK